MKVDNEKPARTDLAEKKNTEDKDPTCDPCSTLSTASACSMSKFLMHFEA